LHALSGFLAYSSFGLGLRQMRKSWHAAILQPRRGFSVIGAGPSSRRMPSETSSRKRGLTLGRSFVVAGGVAGLMRDEVASRLSPLQIGGSLVGLPDGFSGVGSRITPAVKLGRMVFRCRGNHALQDRIIHLRGKSSSMLA